MCKDIGDAIPLEFPSPCGVWVVSATKTIRRGSRPVSVPLRGVGCFLYYERLELSNKEFPSPCGVWVVSVETMKAINIE